MQRWLLSVPATLDEILLLRSADRAGVLLNPVSHSE